MPSCKTQELDALAEEDEDFKIKDDEKLNRDTIYTWRCLRNIAMNDFQLFTKANGHTFIASSLSAFPHVSAILQEV